MEGRLVAKILKNHTQYWGDWLAYFGTAAFVEQIEPELPDGIAIAVVPGHDPLPFELVGSRPRVTQAPKIIDTYCGYG